MPYRVEFLDAANYEGDCLLNSLGRNGKIYGRLCENIIKAADDETIKSTIDNIVDGEIGSIVETGAGKIKCKAILNLITPFKKDDDKNNTKLKKAYTDVIELAIKRGYKSIGLPFIGTGANGYSDLDAYKAVNEVCSNLVLKEDKLNKDLLDILVMAYLDPTPIVQRHKMAREESNFMHNEYKEEFINRTEPNRQKNAINFDEPIVVENCASRPYPKKSKKDLEDEFLNNYKIGENKETLDDDLFNPMSRVYPCMMCTSNAVFTENNEPLHKEKKQEKTIVRNGVAYTKDEWYEKHELVHNDEIYMMIKEISDIHAQNYFLATLKSSDTAFAFVEQYAAAKKVKKNELYKVFSGGKKEVYNKRSGRSPLYKMEIYQLSVLLDMNKTEVIELMTLAGYTFSPINKTDMFMWDYLNGEFDKVNDVEELYKLSRGFVPDDVTFFPGDRKCY